MNFTPTYEIGEPVYHISGAENIGHVVDWRVYGTGMRVEYYVTFSHTDRPMWFSENELIKVKK